MSTFKQFLESELKAVSKSQTEEELGDRSTYIGASDISGCLLSAYLNKKLEVEHDLSKLLIFERGHIAESIIEKALKSKGLHYTPQYEINDEVAGFPVKAHLDFVIESKNELVILEIKTTNRTLTEPYSSWILQVNFQMGLLQKTTNKKVRAKVIAFDLNAGSLSEFPVEFDESMYSIALQKAEELSYSIQNNEAPQPEEQLYCSSCPHKGQCPLFNQVNETIEADEVVFSVETLKTLEKEKKELDNQIKSIKAELEAFCREKGIKKAKVADYLISMSADSSYTSIDTALLKKEDPELFNELISKYSKTTTRKGSLRIK
jgi:CRISPR-associated exonuclease Cas4